jgi:hypothetical protein
LLERAALFAIDNFAKHFQNDKLRVLCTLAGRIKSLESAILNCFALVHNESGIERPRCSFALFEIFKTGNKTLLLKKKMVGAVVPGDFESNYGYNSASGQQG